MRYLLAIFLMALSFNAFSATTTCDDCTSYVARAKSLGVGTHYVVNRTAGVVAKYNVIRRCEGSRCVYEATSMPVEQAVQDYVNYVKQNRNTTVVLGPGQGYPNNGYELVEYPQMNPAVNDYLINHASSIVNDIKRFLNALGPSLQFDASIFPMTVLVVMSDGSTALFQWNKDFGRWDRVKGQTKDSSGNIVPETLAEVAPPGTTTVYYFGGNMTNYIYLISRLHMLGVTFRGDAGSAGQPLVCVTDPETGQVICRAG